MLGSLMRADFKKRDPWLSDFGTACAVLNLHTAGLPLGFFDGTIIHISYSCKDNIFLPMHCI